MKLKTVRVRRSRPSALALALALMLTMSCVYLLSLSIRPEKKADAAGVQITGRAEVRMEPLEAAFLVESRTDNPLEARVLAARCAEAGGAGLVLTDEASYAVIREAVSAESPKEGTLQRSSTGLTLKLEGTAGEISAVSDMIDFMRSQASETGGLATAVENGETDIQSVCTLLSVYRSRAVRAIENLSSLSETNPAIARLTASARANLSRLESALDQPDTGKIKLIHAAACAEWISLSQDLAAGV